MHVSLDLNLDETDKYHVIFVKRHSGTTIDPEKVSLADQLNIFNLPKGDCIELLHNYIKNLVHPLFEHVATRNSNKTDVDNKVNQAKRKFVELEMSLVGLQKNISIPGVNLQIDEFVKTLLLQKDPNLEEIATDVSLLNRLQAGVNEWIREIQKVASLSKDFDFHGFSQEVSFWVSLEKSLVSIEEMLKSPGIGKFSSYRSAHS